MKTWIGRVFLCTLLSVGAMGSLPAQEAGGAQREDAVAGAAELREAMRQYFENRLRAELALSDEQMAALQPHVRALEQSRAGFREERTQTVRRLRRGLEQGAGDAELQTLLDRLDAIDTEQRAGERGILDEIDQLLSVRQRVEFRFVSEQFRRKLQERIEEMRRRGGRGGREGRAGGRP